MPDWSGSVGPSRGKLCSFCIGASEDNREMGVIDPSALPIYFGLHGGEPQVAKNGLVIAKVGKKELERGGGGSGSYV